MKPVPAPRRVGSVRSLRSPRSLSRLGGVKSNGGSKMSGGSGASVRLRRRAPRPLLVASMLTTAGLMRSTTSAKLTDVPGGRPAAGWAPERRPAFFRSGPATTADRVMPPAKMVPTRKATAAVRVSVTKVERRDIYVSIIRARKRSSSSVSTPSFLAFSSLVPGSLPKTRYRRAARAPQWLPRASSTRACR